MNNKQPEQKVSLASVSTQTEVIQKDFISTKVLASFYNESEGFPHFLYKSHTITQMGLLVLLLLYLSFSLEASNMANSSFRGYFLAQLTVIAFATIYFPNSMIQRPHPAFWRMLGGWACCYLMTIVHCLVFSREQFMLFLQEFVDSNLGQPLKEKTFAADCRFYTPDNPHSQFANIMNAMDIFVPAHIIGWMVKMWIVRDLRLAFLQSILFEIMEITFRHWLPNFYECWWDHIILDIIICNSGGILIAHFLMRRFQMKEYKWSLRTQEKKLSFYDNLKDIFFCPNIQKHEWQVLSSTKRFLSVLWFIIFMNLCDLSYFFNKYILWINPDHDFMKWRVFPLGFFSIPAARDYYIYISDDSVTRLGPYGWLMHMIVFVEWLLFIKNYQGTFTNSFPSYVIIIWLVIGTTVVSIIISLIIKDNRVSKQKKLQKLE